MQILKVVLYSFDGRTRELSFQPGAVNIITGESDTGKTAVATIVRYCLGQKKFRVPAGIIRKKVRWFGLLLQLADTQLFIARPNPGPGRSENTEVYYEVGANLEIPPVDRLTSITNVNALTRLLSEKIGIGDNLFEPDEGETRAPVSANIKHAFAYNFQHQNEIASQDFLFHRQSDNWFAQHLKDTFPYFLGAVDADRLRLRQELKQERARLKTLRQELAELTSLQEGGLSRGRSLLAEAAGVGLTSLDANDVVMERVLERLHQVLKWHPELPESGPGPRAMAALEERRAALLARFGVLQMELEAVRNLTREQAAFSEEAAEQRARLRSLNLFPGSDSEPACPVCEAPVSGKLPTVGDLQGSLQRLETHLSTVSTETPKLQRHNQDLETQMRDIRTELADIRAAERDIVEATEQEASPSDLTDRRLMVKGRISFYLESTRPRDDRQTIEDAIAEVLERVEDLEKALTNEDVKRTVTSMLNTMGIYLTEWAKFLKLAHSENFVRIDADQMTIVADTADGGVPLQDMGSGGNWVGYHLVAHLGLHRWFIEKHRPVPRFLFLDQPTQAYYPPEKDWNGNLAELPDEDSAAVRRMFALLFDIARSLAPHFQIIVIDHADFKDPDFVAAVRDRWRDGKKLVPADWPEGFGPTPA